MYMFSSMYMHDTVVIAHDIINWLYVYVFQYIHISHSCDGTIYH